MNLPCKELKRIARDNLNGNYKIPMGAFLAATLIPLAVELPFSMLQKDAQPLPVTIMFYVAEFLITLLSMVLSVGILQLHLSLARKLPESCSQYQVSPVLQSPQATCPGQKITQHL